jgi:hypothetical protein
MKPEMLVTREIFTDVLDLRSEHFYASVNQADVSMDVEARGRALKDKGETFNRNAF